MTTAIAPAGSLGRVVGAALLPDSAVHTGIVTEILGEDLYPALSDQSGAFALPDLAAAPYDLRISKQGYPTVDLPGIELAPSTTVDLGVNRLPEPGLTALIAGLLAVGGLHRWRSRNQTLTARSEIAAMTSFTRIWFLARMSDTITRYPPRRSTGSTTEHPRCGDGKQYPERPTAACASDVREERSERRRVCAPSRLPLRALSQTWSGWLKSNRRL